MDADTVLDEIQDINLTYLLLAQRMLKEDFATALFRLKIDPAMAEVLTSLSARQLGQLSRTNQLLFRLCFDNAEQVKKVTHNRREQGLGQTHAALLMACANSA
ncbi:flagellar transcriptional regulator FlhD [Alloalcanivorax mobilis]|uniref:flagellar transcriptional regulator FlhD n=1 Tax=Alloalcanivorax mobilis TaxID=2019569 RepID=UPI000B5B3B61|nr:flagellar transcriptional regulator FlhD [Alloalcanivorax mobilis]ASK34783.1 flagellar transcriptional regulator FlhD [Alcanivorax sp. N3-2A]|tara:strand:+ start:8145 stop:8453 length:309 start_codon:yes stop_codon:yes gene_type:complete